MAGSGGFRFQVRQEPITISGEMGGLQGNDMGTGRINHRVEGG